MVATVTAVMADMVTAGAAMVGTAMAATTTSDSG
jgi:hypothetical protein